MFTLDLSALRPYFKKDQNTVVIVSDLLEGNSDYFFLEEFMQSDSHRTLEVPLITNHLGLLLACSHYERVRERCVPIRKGTAALPGTHTQSDREGRDDRACPDLNDGKLISLTCAVTKTPGE